MYNFFVMIFLYVDFFSFGKTTRTTIIDNVLKNKFKKKKEKVYKTNYNKRLKIKKYVYKYKNFIMISVKF